MYRFGLSTQCRAATSLWAVVALLLIQGCAPALPLAAIEAKPAAVASLASDFFIPAGIFPKPVINAKPSVAIAADDMAQQIRHAATAPPTAYAVSVALYDSPTTRAYFAKGNVDAKARIQLWENFLRKYEIPYQLVSTADQLDKVAPGVLLMPSSVALSERERRAVVDFRARGGSVLASWLTGVRNETGEWRGFGFMESALDVKVVGTNEPGKKDNYLIPHGDNPVTHHLPAGFRIWLERLSPWQPLRMTGAHSAAHVMDWPRTFSPDTPGAAIVFDERRQSSGRMSRVVVLGYPERLWVSADAKLLEAIAHNALTWLLRQPAAYTAAWPYPHATALMLSIDAPGGLSDTDLSLARLFKEAGARATYYVLSSNSVKSAKSLQQLQSMGHEVGFLGDNYDDFKNQPRGVQVRRFDAMRKETKDAGINLADDAGFSPPMESFDATTTKLLRERRFGHFMAPMDASEARLPFIEAGDTKMLNPLVVLPRTHRGIEPVLSENYAEQGLGIFMDELALSEKMGSLSIITVPTNTFVTAEEWTRLFGYLKSQGARVWLATAGQVAQSWRERARVNARLEPGKTPLLRVTITGEKRLAQAVAIWINLPVTNAQLRVTAREGYGQLPKVGSIDAWRAAIVLDGLAPGEYRWNLHFD